ncbi:MAG TPA: ATP-binding protein, partial [Candidatus Brocadiia bacterium]|nr:ATP-binding protein [Candidatus Brocadiia bacterium]
ESLLATRPFRSPHHTISDVALVGGGANPTPGEVSLSHHGVLFLDELPEFNRRTLEVLRQPMEDGHITVSRAKASITYPSQFTLVAAMNPCPCGYFTDPRRACHCTPPQVQKYLSRISGPLLDRIDIQIETPAVDYRQLRSAAPGDSSATMRQRVLEARERQTARFRRSKTPLNARMTSGQIKKHCGLAEDAEQLLSRAMQELALSARAFTKILKISRTIADLDAAEEIQIAHVAEAIQYRSLDRNLWA